MISGKVKKLMKSTLVRLAQRESDEAHNIGIFIHTKQQDLSPQYFYTVGGQVKKNDKDEVIELDFKRDILATKIDMIGQEAISANFLRNYFKTLSEEIEKNPHELYIAIGTSDSEASDLVMGLYENSEQVKPLTLEEVFGD